MCSPLPFRRLDRSDMVKIHGLRTVYNYALSCPSTSSVFSINMGQSSGLYYTATKLQLPRYSWMHSTNKGFNMLMLNLWLFSLTHPLKHTHTQSIKEGLQGVINGVSMVGHHGQFPNSCLRAKSLFHRYGNYSQHEDPYFPNPESYPLDNIQSWTRLAIPQNRNESGLPKRSPIKWIKDYQASILFR